MLSNVERVQLEAESIYLAHQGIDQKPRDTFPTIFSQTLTEHAQILAELSGVLVRIRVVGFMARQDQAGQHIIQKTPVDFVWRMSFRIEVRRRNSRRISVECCFELRREWNLMSRRTELPNQIVHSLDVVVENRFASYLQRISRAF